MVVELDPGTLPTVIPPDLPSPVGTGIGAVKPPLQPDDVPTVVPPTETPPVTPKPEPTDSLDIGNDLEAGPEPSEDDYQAWEDELSGGVQILAATHAPPGTIIGYPYEGTHAVDFNRAGGSDNWQSENAVDVWLYPGTYILAVLDGVISPGGYGFGLSASGGRFAGYRCHLVTGDGKVFFYTHMYALNVKQGQRVSKGALIGFSGIANGVPHLHFAVNPPYRPQAFYADAFNIHQRNKTVGAGVIGDAGIQAPPPKVAPTQAKGPKGTFTELMGVFAKDVPNSGKHATDVGNRLVKGVR